MWIFSLFKGKKKIDNKVYDKDLLVKSLEDTLPCLESIDRNVNQMLEINKKEDFKYKEEVELVFTEISSLLYDYRKDLHNIARAIYDYFDKKATKEEIKKLINDINKFDYFLKMEIDKSIDLSEKLKNKYGNNKQWPEVLVCMASWANMLNAYVALLKNLVVVKNNIGVIEIKVD